MAEPTRREDEDGMLMHDILSAQEELEETVTAVLGDSDDKNCTYGQGYVKRQAVYSCSTCLAPNGEPAAICLACSLECHEGHNLIELYTKRSLRCDCGNSKFPPGFTCRLLSDKEAVNDGNVYNQNFSGRYCVCKRPYPDPDDDVEDEMLQCAVCEDWFHTRHLGVATVPREDSYEEMICGVCTTKLDFLCFYVTSSFAAQKKEPTFLVAKSDVVNGYMPPSSAVKRDHQGNAKGAAAEVAAAGSTEAKVEPALRDDGSCKLEPTAQDDRAFGQPSGIGAAAAVLARGSAVKSESLPPTSSNTVLPSAADANGAGQLDPTAQEVADVDLKPPPPAVIGSPARGSRSSQADGGSSCLLSNLKETLPTPVPAGSATFWPSGWRSGLCKCSECRAMYNIKAVGYLLDESDTLAAYEDRGRLKERLKDDAAEQQQAAEFLSLNRVQQIEILQGINDLKSGLADFLQSFAREGKVVREEDVRGFFDELRRKRQRAGVSHFCR